MTATVNSPVENPLLTMNHGPHPTLITNSSLSRVFTGIFFIKVTGSRNSDRGLVDLIGDLLRTNNHVITMINFLNFLINTLTLATKGDPCANLPLMSAVLFVCKCVSCFDRTAQSSIHDVCTPTPFS